MGAAFTTGACSAGAGVATGVTTAGGAAEDFSMGAGVRAGGFAGGAKLGSKYLWMNDTTSSGSSAYSLMISGCTHRKDTHS